MPKHYSPRRLFNAVANLLRKPADSAPVEQSTTGASNALQQGMGDIASLLQAGDLVQAEAAARQLQQHHPENPEVAKLLGSALLGLRKDSEVVELFQNLLQVQPGNADIHLNLGLAQLRLAETEQALQHFQHAATIAPQSANAHYFTGMALSRMARWHESTAAFDCAIALQPDYAEVYENRGLNLQHMGRTKEAIASHRQAVELEPGFVDAYNSLCVLYEKTQDLTGLQMLVDQAAMHFPAGTNELLFWRGLLASMKKQQEQAKDWLEQIDSSKLSPKSLSPYSNLLAKTYDKLGLYEEAFAQFGKTNAIARDSQLANMYSANRYRAIVELLLNSWQNTSTGVRPWIGANYDTLPYQLSFLVGFPRSGTTLLDSILRSHSRVEVLEEKPMVQTMITALGQWDTCEAIDELSDEKVAALRQAYIDELEKHADIQPGITHVIDKLPLNLVNVGIIRRVFPEAKFILALRHPCDCVLSCYIQNFDLNDAMANFLSLEQSAVLYDKAMSLWTTYNEALDLEVFSLKYENLVRDLPATVAPLLSFLGLEWSDKLLDYRQTALARTNIDTPSYNQVTQKLYTQSSGRWENYRHFMQPVLPVLHPWIKCWDYPD